MGPMSRRRFLRSAGVGLLTTALQQALLQGVARAAGVAYYVDSTYGSDVAGGTSPSAPWRTFANLRAQQFQPGDQILLRRDRTWAEPLALRGVGTPLAPIVLGAYGQGSAPLVDGSGWGPALALVDQEGWVVQDLALTNSAGQTGLLLDSTTGRRSYFRVRRVEVFGCWYGMEIGRFKDGSGVNGGCLDDVALEGCLVHDVGYKGITSAGNYGDPSLPRNTNLVFQACEVYNCGWDGIMMTSTSGGVITDCVAHDCGHAADARYGIWAWWADHVTIQRCEAYGMRTPGSKDGGGFDLDWGTSDSAVQHCYAHDNDGPGFAIIGNRQAPANTPQRNVIRYNVSQGNCRKPSGISPYGEIVLFGGMNDTAVVNNTLYWDDSDLSRGAIKLFGWGRDDYDWPSSTTVSNNITVTTAGSRALWVESQATSPTRRNAFHHNCYFSPSGDLNIRWGKKSYSTLSTFENRTGQEFSGLQADPRLTEPGAGGIGRLPLDEYRLLPDSPCAQNGAWLPQMGESDYWGTPLSATRPLSRGADQTG